MAHDTYDGLSIGDVISELELQRRNVEIYNRSLMWKPDGGTAADGSPTGVIMPKPEGSGGGTGIEVVEDVPAYIPPGKVVGVTSGQPAQTGSGRKYATLVVGTALMGHTEADVDILLTGANDHVLLQQAHDALPSAGGKLFVREGICNLGGQLVISKPNVTIEGMGFSTIFRRMYNEAGGDGFISMTASYCTLANLAIHGNRSAYTSTFNHGIRITAGSHSKLLNLRIYDVQTGIWSSISDYTIARCLFDGTLTRAMYMNASNGLICENSIKGGSTGINLYSAVAVNNTLSNNSIQNTSVGILLSGGAARNAIVGNHVMRGTGLSGDYAADQYTIRLTDSTTVNNLITNNMIFGKDVTNEGGTGNTLADNKFN